MNQKAVEIVLLFEDFLEERDVRIPTSEKELVAEGRHRETDTRIYGSDFAELVDSIAYILEKKEDES